MKVKLILSAALLSLAISASAQTIIPIVELGYTPVEQYKIIQSDGSGSTIFMPNCYSNVGFRSDWRRLTIISTNEFAERFDRGTFMPVQATFTVDLRIKMNEFFDVGVKHWCLHPLRTDGVNDAGIYGGGTRIYVTFFHKH